MSPVGTNVDSPGTAYLFTSRRNSTSDDSDSFGSSNCSGALDFFGTGGLSLSSHEAEEALLFVPGLIDLFDTRGLLLNLLEAEEAFFSLPCSLGSGVEADLGKQPLLSFLGSGDDVFFRRTSALYLVFSPYHFLSTIDNALAE